jgi:dolichol-phosphate mannosyltransferase
MNTQIVIPTYNEKDNITSLIKAVRNILPSALITVVDDNSPDGTSSIVEPLTKKDKQISLIKRKGKGGRGSAVIRGFSEGLKKKDIGYFIEMDGDFSHDPKELKSILASAKNNDVVIGARYLRSSRILNWPIQRRIFSFFANLYAKSILWVPIVDYTNGYRCYSRLVLETIGLSHLKETGYAALMEMIFLVHKFGFKIGQVPTIFVNRKRGQSNTSLREIANAFSAPLRIRSRH